MDSHFYEAVLRQILRELETNPRPERAAERVEGWCRYALTPRDVAAPPQLPMRVRDECAF